MKKIAVIGAGGHGKVVAEIAELMGVETIVFFEKNFSKKRQVLRWQCVGSDAEIFGQLEYFDGVFVAVGDNKIRSEIIMKLKKASAKIITLIHPAAAISRSASIGAGTVVMANVVVNADAKIGNGVILNTASTVDHDCMVDDFAHISPGAHLSGGVAVGKQSWIGAGAVVKHDITIGNQVIIGAGAAVTSDIDSNSKAVGVPARLK